MEDIIGIVLLFMLTVVLNVSICSCVWISISRGKKLESLGTMDNFFYMRLIRILLILSSTFLFIECIGFLFHYSYHNHTTNNAYNKIFDIVNVSIIHNKNIFISDLIVYFGFLCFLLCSVGAYYISLHRFLLTNQESNSFNETYTNRLLIVCIICYVLISVTCVTFSVINLFVTVNSKLYYVLLICFDIQLILSSIPVFQSLKKVIAISRDSAKSVRWSVTSVSPSKLYYKMSVKAVRMGMENIILNILLLVDIGCCVYEIVFFDAHKSIHNGIPSNFEAAHIIIVYFIQLFIMLFTVDYTWINRKYVTVKHCDKPTRAHVNAQRRYQHSRDNFSDFDYDNTVLKKPKSISINRTEIVKLKAASPKNGENKTDLDNMGELEFLNNSGTMQGRSASFTQTIRNKRKVNNEILSKKSSEPPIKRRDSVFSLIPKAAKRMSRSFVETVISADKLWDEQDCNTRRYSRHNIKKTQKSRRFSMPNAVHSKSKAKSFRKSTTFIPRINSDNTLKPNDNNHSLTPDIPTSPVSCLDSDDNVSFPSMINMVSLSPKASHNIQFSDMTERDSLALPISDMNNKSAVMHRVPSESISASPITYAYRMHNLRNSPELSPMAHGYNSSTSTNGTNGSNGNKRKLFNYNHKILLTDRASDDSIVSLSNQTDKSAKPTYSRKGSNISELSEIPETIRPNTFAIPKFCEEIEAIGQNTQYKGKNEKMKGSIMHSIQESKSQMMPKVRVKRLSLKGHGQSSINSNVSVDHINEIYHSTELSNSQTLEDMEEMLNEIDVSDSENEVIEPIKIEIESGNVKEEQSLRVDIEAMDHVLDSIEHNAEMYIN